MPRPSLLESLMAEPTIKVAADQRFSEIKGLAETGKKKDVATALVKIAQLSDSDFRAMTADQITFITGFAKKAADTTAVDGNLQDSAKTEIGAVTPGPVQDDLAGNSTGEAVATDASTAPLPANGDASSDTGSTSGEQPDEGTPPDAPGKKNKTDAPDATSSKTTEIMEAVKKAALLEGMEEYFQETIGVIKKKASQRLETAIDTNEKIAALCRKHGPETVKAVLEAAFMKGISG